MNPKSDRTLDPALIERFRTDLARVWPDDPDLAEVSLGVAVSGGPDSLALLLLAHAAMPGRVSATTVDHGLRPESRSEAEFVADVCAQIGVPHAILPVQLEAGNTQAMARAARYDALSSHFAGLDLTAFSTAHHADDQAETLLMRLNRGSGLSGLAGVRPWSILITAGGGFEVCLLRPLLGWRREELAGIVRAAGIAPVRDPANTDDAYDRARLRKAIADLDWLDPPAMARSAHILAEAELAVEHCVDQTIRKCCIWADGGCAFRWGHPRLIEIGVVGHILQRLGAFDLRKSEIARMIDRLRSKQNASLGGVLARRRMYPTGQQTETDVMWFEREPPRSS